MLAKPYRITEDRLYGKIQREGKVHQYESFGIVILNRKDKDYSRFGFVVSSKISKLSVDRNLYKRIMSEAIRINMYRMKKGFDVVFLGKPSLLKTPTSDLMKQIVKAIEERRLVN